MPGSVTVGNMAVCPHRRAILQSLTLSPALKSEELALRYTHHLLSLIKHSFMVYIYLLFTGYVCVLLSISEGRTISDLDGLCLPSQVFETALKMKSSCRTTEPDVPSGSTSSNAARSIHGVSVTTFFESGLSGNVTLTRRT